MQDVDGMNPLYLATLRGHQEAVDRNYWVRMLSPKAKFAQLSNLLTSL
jgi:hypothetical protein